MVAPEDILAYWLDEIGPAGWYKQSEALDADIRDKFESSWNSAMEGRFALWLTYPGGTLAYLILLDQFSRNMFRGTAKAFTSDRVALAASKSAVHKGYDKKIDPPARQFFYMPMMHSENLCDQDRCVRLMMERMGADKDINLLHARAHREIIRQFGRFPFRNGALSRKSTGPEQEFLAGRGYGEILEGLRKAS